ncbi:MAG: hypothetical protein AAF329_14000 [Cyanobacteria bacterium P01_A01_bin.17]
MKYRLLPILFAVTLGIGSCRSEPTTIQVTAPALNPTPAIAGEVLVSNQGIVQLNRPHGWTDQLIEEDTLNLKMSNESGDAHLTLQTRAKKDLPQFSLEKFARMGREAGLQTMTDLKITGPTEVTLANGYPAIQYQFRGEVEGAETVLLHTAIESPNYFHQILAGSSRFGFERHQPTLQKIIQTFQEIPVTASGQ